MKIKLNKYVYLLKVDFFTDFLFKNAKINGNINL